MKKPWQIWAAFLLTFVVALAATCWLSLKTIELENLREEERRQIELARREAELQERVNSALYRMDWVLTPLIAQEAARPYYLYDSFYRPPAFNSSPGVKGAAPAPSAEPSPLLMETSEFVYLHFQISPEGTVNSPQRPQGAECEKAMVCCGITPETVSRNDSLLSKATKFASYEVLLPLCPPLKAGTAGSGDLGIGETVYLDNSFESRLINTPPLDNNSQSIQDNGYQQQMDVANNALDIQKTRTFNRSAGEFQQRKKSAEQMAQQQWNALNSSIYLGTKSSAPIVREGVMRPVWVRDHLLLVRRVEGEKSELVQCCWLNWDRIQKELSKEVNDILPGAQLEPIRENQRIDFGRALAALPVQVVVDSKKLLTELAIRPPADSPWLSGVRWALILAWAGLLFAATAVALLLMGVLRLSERRAAFVSAVTHELRTPLTTFKMYAEMLSEEMVPEHKKKDYAQTLTGQADRLSHLVENVLQFARLESVPRKSRLEKVPVNELFSNYLDRLHQRAESDGMKLAVNRPEMDDKVSVDDSKLEQILFNLVDNACKYGKDGDENRIVVDVELRKQNLVISVRDFGEGVSADVRKKLFQPFSKSDQEAANSAAGVGLGLALCKRMVQSLGGRLRLVDSDSGAKFEVRLPQP